MDYRDKILAVVRLRPVVPMVIAKNLGVNSIIASAMLSEMVSKKILRLTSLKIGSSPLYYVPENEKQLEDYASKLDDKSFQAYELLKSKGVLRESTQSPLVRVCLKKIKDFAKPLEVSFNGGDEIFYKYFLMSDEDAKAQISDIINPPKPTPPTKEAVKEVVKEVTQEVEVVKEKEVNTVIKESDVKERPQSNTEPKKVTAKIDTDAPDVQKELASPLHAQQITDLFLKDLITYFQQQNIRVFTHDLKRKNAEVHLEIGIPTSLGQLRYFCLAKNKKRVADSDLSTTFVQAQIKKLPGLFLSRGELTKKAKELLKDLKGLTVTTF
jgi:hypothetical protein